MSDLPPEQRPTPQTTPPPESPTPTSEPTHTESLPVQETAHDQPPPQRFRDRVWGLRTVIAVALVAVILGGLGGAALASLGDHHEGDRFGPGHGKIGHGRHGVPPGMMRRWMRQHGQGRQQPWGDGQGVPPVMPPPGNVQPSPALPTPSSTPPRSP